MVYKKSKASFLCTQASCAGPVLCNIYSFTFGNLTNGILVSLIGYSEDKTCNGWQG